MSQGLTNEQDGIMEADGRLFIGEEIPHVDGLEFMVVPSDLLADPTEALTEDASVEQALHIINCLNAIAAANMRRGLQKAQGFALKPGSYSGREDQVVKGAGRKADKFELEAKRYFAKACGLDKLIAEDPSRKDELRAETRQAYGKFLETFSSDHKTLDKTRRKLRKFIKTGAENEDIDVIKTITTINRQYKTRIYEEVASEADTVTPEQDQQLSYRHRLEALRFDPRAGFLPTTRRELNIAVSYLDYLDNPDYELGVVSQLFEVVMHQQKIGGFTAKEGLRAVESITWEIGDYAIDAALALTSIRQLAEAIEATNPNLILVGVDEIGNDNPALSYFFQYFDFLELVQNGQVMYLDRDPGRTEVVRIMSRDGRELEGTDPGKHKRVYSQYTRPDKTAAFEKHFVRRLTSLTVKDLRKALPEIIENHEQRLEFMLARLQETDRFFSQNQSRLTTGIKRAVTDSEAVVYAIFVEANQEPEVI